MANNFHPYEHGPDRGPQQRLSHPNIDDDGGAALLRLLQSNEGGLTEQRPAFNVHPGAFFSRMPAPAPESATYLRGPKSPGFADDSAVAAMGPGRPLDMFGTRHLDHQPPPPPILHHPSFYPGNLATGATIDGLPGPFPRPHSLAGGMPPYGSNIPHHLQRSNPNLLNSNLHLHNNNVNMHSNNASLPYPGPGPQAELAELRRLGSGEDLLRLLQASSARAAVPHYPQPNPLPAFPGEALSPGSGVVKPPLYLANIWGSPAPAPGNTIWQPLGMAAAPRPPVGFPPQGPAPLLSTQPGSDLPDGWIERRTQVERDQGAISQPYLPFVEQTSDSAKKQQKEVRVSQVAKLDKAEMRKESHIRGKYKGEPALVEAAQSPGTADRSSLKKAKDKEDVKGPSQPRKGSRDSSKSPLRRQWRPKAALTSPASPPQQSKQGTSMKQIDQSSVSELEDTMQHANGLEEPERDDQEDLDSLQETLMKQLGIRLDQKGDDVREQRLAPADASSMQPLQELTIVPVESIPERLASPGAGAQALAQASANAEARQQAREIVQAHSGEAVPSTKMRGLHPGLRQIRNARERPDLPQMSNDLLAIVRDLIPPEEEDRAKSAFVQRLTDLMGREWPGAKLHLFGSCANSFGLRNSDVDVCLAVEGDEGQDKGACITRAAAILKDDGMRSVQALTHARVPIVKFTDHASHMSCDICVNNLLAVANTKLLYDYASIDPRLRQLAFLVKHWAKRRQVNETYRGTLSSYAYVLMCIFYLQTRNPPILPCLQTMVPATFKANIGGVDCAYYDRVANLRNFGAANKESLAELLAGFFEYWNGHDYNKAVISVRMAHFISKEEKGWTRRVGNERHLICIEDPFETSHDLGRVVDRVSIRVLREEFFRAAKVFRHERDPVGVLFEPYVRDGN